MKSAAHLLHATQLYSMLSVQIQMYVSHVAGCVMATTTVATRLMRIVFSAIQFHVVLDSSGVMIISAFHIPGNYVLN